MTINMPDYEAQTNPLQDYGFAAVGIVVPEATILRPSVAEHTDGVMRTPEGTETPFMLTHDGMIDDIHKLANRYGISGVDEDNNTLGKNIIIGGALQKQLESGYGFDEAFMKTVPHLRGAFSIIAKQDRELYAARDRYGYGTMFIGQIASGGFVASSQEEPVKELNPTAIMKLEPGVVARIGEQAIAYTRWAYPVHEKLT